MDQDIEGRHVHTGIFALIGVLILVSIGIGGYFLYKEQEWEKERRELTEQFVLSQEQLAVYQLNSYEGPYGVLSYVKYNQVQSVPSAFPVSNITSYDQASCTSLVSEDGVPTPSNEFDIVTFDADGSLLGDIGESRRQYVQEVFRSSLVWTDSEKVQQPLYNLTTICDLGNQSALLIGLDSSNSALRVPIILESGAPEWQVRKLPPTLQPFVENSFVRIYPDGNPILFDVHQDSQGSAWQAYYIDTKFQVVDLIESCRVVKQDAQYVRICERLYGQ